MQNYFLKMYVLTLAVMCLSAGMTFGSDSVWTKVSLLTSSELAEYGGYDVWNGSCTAQGNRPECSSTYHSYVDCADIDGSEGGDGNCNYLTITPQNVTYCLGWKCEDDPELKDCYFIAEVNCKLIQPCKRSVTGVCISDGDTDWLKADKDECR